VNDLLILVNSYNTAAIAISIFLILLALVYALADNRVIPALLLVAVLAVPILYALSMFHVL